MLGKFIGAFLVLLILSGSSARAQFLVDLNVDVTQEDELYTYTYTLTNTSFSFSSINSLQITTDRDAEVENITGPDGWFSFFDNDLLPSFQAVWGAGDGFTCGDGEPAEIQPGQQQTFTIESTWAPAEQDYALGRLVTTAVDPVLECQFLGDVVEGTILSPSIPPTPIVFEPCDFDEDGDCDIRDINFLALTVGLGDHDPTYELTGDDLVNLDDIDEFLTQVNRFNGDADFNGIVDFADFLTLSGNFGMTELFWEAGDFDGDGTAAFSDFLILSGNFGKGELIVASQAVPEPELGVGIFNLVLLGFASRRSRRP